MLFCFNKLSLIKLHQKLFKAAPSVHFSIFIRLFVYCLRQIMYSVGENTCRICFQNILQNMNILCSKIFIQLFVVEHFTTQDIHILQNILETYSACISALSGRSIILGSIKRSSVYVILICCSNIKADIHAEYVSRIFYRI